MLLINMNGRVKSTNSNSITDNNFLNGRVRATLNFIDWVLYDSSYGGFYHYSDRSGLNKDEFKYASLHAWVSMVYLNLSPILKSENIENKGYNALSFLINNLWDNDNGGFWHCVTRNGSISQAPIDRFPRQKYTTYQAWACLWLINAYKYSLDLQYLSYANSSLEFLINHLWDDEYHGFFRSCRENGSMIEDIKEVYGQFWAVAALLEYSKIQNNDSIRINYISPTLEFIFTYLWDPINGGFFDKCYGNGTYPDSIKNIFNQASSIYSLIQIYKFTLNETYLDAYITPSIQFILKFLWDPTYQGFYESCNGTGGNQITNKNPTYEAMISWSLLEYAQITSNNTFISEYIVPTINFVNEFLWDSKYGGFYEKCSLIGTPIGTEKWFNDQFFMIFILSKLLVPITSHIAIMLFSSIIVISLTFSILSYYLFKHKKIK